MVIGTQLNTSVNQSNQCLYDGGEIGSTGVGVFNRVNANDNFTSVDYAIAA